MGRRRVLMLCAICASLGSVGGWWIGHLRGSSRGLATASLKTEVVPEVQTRPTPTARDDELAAQIDQLSYPRLSGELPTIVAKIGQLFDEGRRQMLANHLALALTRITEEELARRTAQASVTRAASDTASHPPEEPSTQAASMQEVPEQRDEMLRAYLASPSYEEVALAVDRLSSDTPPEEISRVASSIMSVADPQDREALLSRFEEQIRRLLGDRAVGEATPQDEAAPQPEQSPEAVLRVMRPDPLELQSRLTRLDLQREQDIEELKEIAISILSVEHEQDREALLRLLEEKLQKR